MKEYVKALRLGKILNFTPCIGSGRRDMKET